MGQGLRTNTLVVAWDGTSVDGESAPIDEAEDLVLANADEYVRQRRLARADYAKGRTVGLEDLD